jgi:hypothetical protein
LAADEDENVMMMRETARQIGLTDLLLAMHRSSIGDLRTEDNRERLREARDLLGAREAELQP